MSELLNISQGKSEQFVHSAEIASSDAKWAYLHSHKLRDMN